MIAGNWYKCVAARAGRFGLHGCPIGISRFPGAFKFATKNAIIGADKIEVSVFVSRGFQFPPYMCKTGNFAAVSTLQPFNGSTVEFLKKSLGETR